MSTGSDKRRRDSTDDNDNTIRKRLAVQQTNSESREIGSGTEFEVLQAYRDFEDAVNQERVQMARTGNIEIAMKSLETVDSLYKRVEGTRNNGLFAHDARAMVCISELAEISVRNLKFDDSRSLVNLDDVLNSFKRYMLQDFFAKNGISEVGANVQTTTQDESQESGNTSEESGQHTLNISSKRNAADLFKESVTRKGHLRQFSSYKEFSHFNWFKLGSLYNQLSKAPQTVDHLLGPLSLTRKVRAPITRRERETVGSAITAEKVTQTSASSSQELTTPEHVRRCFKTLLKKKGQEKINLYEFIIDPTSFAKSVENLFYVSFLIKEGRLIMEDDARGFPWVRVKEDLPSNPKDKGIELQKRRDAQQNHIIFQLDMPTWKALIQKLEIKEAFLD